MNLICRGIVSPVLQGLDNLPGRGETRPLLFVGNHSRLGVYDLPWMLSELYLRGIKVGTPASCCIAWSACQSLEHHASSCH